MANQKFEAGVIPGGLREQQDIELLICYLLSSVGTELSREMLYESISPQGLANYFGIGQALSALIANGNVLQRVTGGTEMLSISEQSRVAVAQIETSLPYSVREKALSAALLLLSRARSAKQTQVELDYRPNGSVLVTCTVREGEQIMMQVSVLVADELQALTVKENFLADPSLVYSGVLALLAGKPEILREQMEQL